MHTIGDSLAGLVSSRSFGVFLTLIAFEIGSVVQRRCHNSPLANPVFIAIVLIVVTLEFCGISYQSYLQGASLIAFLLGPATVALALPIYSNGHHLRAAAPGILAGVAVGAIVASASAVGIAYALGAPDELLRSIAPKSVTTPIAIGISEEIGGHAPLTAVFVIASGIIGAMLSGHIFGWIGVRDWRVRGLATGIASHGIGTAQMLAVNEVAGAFSGLGIGLTGLFTAVLLPVVVNLLQ